MISADTHGDVDIVLSLVDVAFLEGRVFQSCNLLLGLDNRLEDISIIIRVLTLHHTDQALEAHTSIDHVHREFLERAVGLAVKLHEHEVPDLNHLRIILVHELTAALA